MTCIIRKIIKIPCPTCGVTRAMLSLLTGNIQKYFYYNPMALPLCLAVFLMLAGNRFKIKFLQIASFVILLLNIPFYIFRLMNNSIP